MLSFCCACAVIYVYIYFVHLLDDRFSGIYIRICKIFDIWFAAAPQRLSNHSLVSDLSYENLLDAASLFSLIGIIVNKGSHPKITFFSGQ